MRRESAQWVQMGPAASPAEQHALDRVRELLPETPTTYAWANLTFIDLQGRTNELDVLVWHGGRLTVLELKGWAGSISGNQQIWRRVLPGGQVRTERNPHLLNDSKAKRLASYLKSLLPGPASHAVPFVEAVTVLHGQSSTVTLDPTGKVNTYGLDGYQVVGLPLLSEWIGEAGGQPDKATSSRVVKLLQDAGFVQTPRQRMVGPYVIEGDPVGEGASWIDYLATHPVIAKQKRRIRLFDVPRNPTAAQRGRVQHLAKREYLLTNGLSHPGVVGPLEIYDLESGPALIFADDSADSPLVDFLADGADRLTRGDRLAVIRQLAEVIRFAHEHRVVHRALTPFAVFVAQGPAGPVVRVRDWQTGRAESDGLTGTHTSGVTVHVASAVVQDSWVWLAPESQAEAASGVELDVYGLGVVAYLILTGTAPATNVVELQARLSQGGGLDPRVHADLEVALADLVADATRGDVSTRTPDVAWFIEALNEAENAYRAVDEVGEAVDPLTATPADLIDDRWLVDERLGSGGTGIALLAFDTTHDDRVVVLKVAHDDSRAERLDAEAAVLVALDHPRIVRAIEGPLKVGQRRMLVLEDAGRPTLGGRISNEGRLTIEQLATYGSDLFDIAAYLDAQGRFHRDIKPENLGVREASSAEGRRPSLVLFDFSLSAEPLEHTKSGTRGYLDPFLGTKERPRYDRAAERFAIAATLFHMATGQRPEWGDGVSDPSVISDEVTLTPALFDEGIATELVGFFSRALARNASARFDSLADMGSEWARIFDTLEVRDPADEEAAQEARDGLAAVATLTTRLAESGLTKKATSAAARLGAETVGELIGLNAARINNAPGLGVAVRREMQDRRRQWRDALTASTTTTQDEPVGAMLGVEAIAAALVPKPNGRNADTVALARRILLIDPPPGDLTTFPWPTLEQVTESLGMDLARGRAAIDGLERHWAKPTGMAATIRHQVDEALAILGGVATSDELADRFVATMGSTAEGARRRANAAALVRAAVESDLALDPDESGLAALRHPHQPDMMMLAVADGPKGAQAPTRLAAAVALAGIVDAELERMPLITTVAATDLLTSDQAGAALAVDDPTRALAVASAASTSAAVSSRGEVYRRDLGPARIVAAVLGSATVGVIAPNRLARLAADRFPGAAPLPGRPALDTLVQAESSLRWDGSAYSRPSDPSSMLISSTRVTTMTPAGLLPHAEVEARLRASLEGRAGTVLAVEPRLVATTAEKLAERFGLRPVDMTAEILAAMHAVADSNGVDWSLVLRSDAAGPREPDRLNLNRLVAAALDAVWPPLMASADPLLLHGLGPLARYGHLKRLAELIDLSTSRPAARWILVGHRPSADAPSLDGVPVPLGASGWIDIPLDLLKTPLPRRPAS